MRYICMGFFILLALLALAQAIRVMSGRSKPWE